MTHTVFIDGEAGTTGLQIRQRLAGRRDLTLVSIDPEKRKDPEARAELLNSAEAVVLCLPDDAAREAVDLITEGSVRVVDPSTAHRIAPDWAFGFPELAKGQREAISASKRVSNPGCYSTGFIALVRPLVDAGVLPTDFPVSCNAVSGYTGGGKGLIAEMEGAPPNDASDAYRAYGLTLAHKHVPEMQLHTGLAHPPLFAPSVGRYAQGMIVEVPLHLWALPGTPEPEDLRRILAGHYADERFVDVASEAECAELAKARAGAGGYVAALDPEALNGANQMKLFVFGNPGRGQVRLLALLDNLGKGASGACVQNLNLMLGLEEGAGL
jgi:N-acetyl-gamma-glutamyl-phosphate reductase